MSGTVAERQILQARVGHQSIVLLKTATRRKSAPLRFAVDDANALAPLAHVLTLERNRLEVDDERATADDSQDAEVGRHDEQCIRRTLSRCGPCGLCIDIMMIVQCDDRRDRREVDQPVLAIANEGEHERNRHERCHGARLLAGLPEGHQQNRRDR